MIAACSAVKPAAAAFGSAPCRAGTRPDRRNPECAASTVALTPQASASFTLAPAATSSFADARSPTRAANISAVSPPCGIARLYSGMPCGGTAITWLQTSERAWTSAPCASSTFTTSGCFCATAHISAVWPRAPRAFTFGALGEQLFDDVGIARAGRRPSAASRRAGARRSDSRRPAAAAGPSPRCRSGWRSRAAWRRDRSPRSPWRRRESAGRRSRHRRGSSPSAARSCRPPSAALTFAPSLSSARTRLAVGVPAPRRSAAAVGAAQRRIDTRRAARHDAAIDERSQRRHRMLTRRTSVSIGSLPVLPPICSTGTSSLSISVTSRFAIDGLSVYARCRPPLSRPAPPPTSSSGRLSPECRVAVGDARAVQDRHVIEQRAVAVGRRAQLRQILREQLACDSG